MQDIPNQTAVALGRITLNRTLLTLAPESHEQWFPLLPDKSVSGEVRLDILYTPPSAKTAAHCYTVNGTPLLGRQACLTQFNSCSGAQPDMSRCHWYETRSEAPL